MIEVEHQLKSHSKRPTFFKFVYNLRQNQQVLKNRSGKLASLILLNQCDRQPTLSLFLSLSLSSGCPGCPSGPCIPNSCDCRRLHKVVAEHLYLEGCSGPPAVVTAGLHIYMYIIHAGDRRCRNRRGWAYITYISIISDALENHRSSQLQVQRKTRPV